jgi:ubiquinone/menaquinone biosynthesis C-methylase UbiE
MTLPGFFEGTEMPDPDWWEALWPDPGRVIRDVGITPSMTVVDLCSGDGWFTLQLSRIGRAVIAIDIDGKLLEAARVRLAESGRTNCVFIEANAYDLAKVVRHPVDYVLLANAFHGVSDKPRLAGAVHDVLGPGGLFGVGNWHARPAAHAAEVLKREPKFSVAVYLATHHYKREVDHQRHEAGLLKAGLPV